MNCCTDEIYHIINDKGMQLPKKSLEYIAKDIYKKKRRCIKM